MVVVVVAAPVMILHPAFVVGAIDRFDLSNGNNTLMTFYYTVSFIGLFVVSYHIPVESHHITG